MTAERQEVYAAIDSERAYQQQRWSHVVTRGQEPGERSLDEWVNFIEEYTQHLIDADESERLDAIRKVAGLCVAAMEQHGAPHR